MRKLLKRWYVWLALVMLLPLGLSTSAALIYSNQGRISQANFDRIQNGMTEEEATEILGESDPNSGWAMSFGDGSSMRYHIWSNGPNTISLNVDDGKVSGKEIHLASARETLEWYAKKGWRKIKGAGN